MNRAAPGFAPAPPIRSDDNPLRAPLPFRAALGGAFAILALAFTAASAQTQPPAPERTGTPAAAPAERTEIKAPAGDPLAPLGWLEGCWHGTAGPREFDERWSAQRDGAMSGSSETRADGKTVSHEDLRLEARADGVYYVVAPSGQKESAFRLAESTLDRTAGRSDEIFVFAAPGSGFPASITYRRASEGWLYATLDGKVGGQDRQLTYPLRRVDCKSGELILR